MIGKCSVKAMSYDAGPYGTSRCKQKPRILSSQIGQSDLLHIVNKMDLFFSIYILSQKAHNIPPNINYKTEDAL